MTIPSQENVLSGLIRALRCLPGVGPKSAQRMTYHLLQRDRDGAQRLLERLSTALEEIRQCRECRTLTEGEVCAVCASGRRNRAQLCVVESASEMTAILEATDYQGLFFVLHGRLSPLDGMGPGELGLDALDRKLGEAEVEELILATSTTLEGEATAFYIQQMAQERSVSVSRLAYGMPLGGELEQVDGATLLHAFKGRRLQSQMEGSSDRDRGETG